MTRSIRLSEAILFGLSGVVFVAALGLWSFGVRLNLSDSAPVGVWTTDSFHTDELSYGRMVSICPRDTATTRAMLAAGFLPVGSCSAGSVPLLKPIVALPGDLVSIDPDGVRVNGSLLANSAPANTTVANIQLHGYGHDAGVTQSRYEVLEEQVWVVSSYSSNSYDSRYFGPLSISDIRWTATPLLTRGDLAATYQRANP